MSPEERIHRERIICQAEGYLELGMPEHTIEALAEFSLHQRDGKIDHLLGEAYRALERYAEAVDHLQRSAEAVPDDIHVLLALAWCHKRTGKIDQAIEALENALEVDPSEAILYYNLSCYCSLTGDRRRALRHLAQALTIDSDYRDLVNDEPDFDPLRNDPDFQELMSVIV